MLFKQKIISFKIKNKIVYGLNKIEKEISNKKFEFNKKYEDIHMNIEKRLFQIIGEEAGYVHTARSRNDQVLVALQLYYKEQLSTIKEFTGTFFNTLLELAEIHKSSLLPGYTHLQVAMPSSFGLWFSSYAELLIDDVYVLDAAFKTVNQNPLGSAAGYGSSFPVDREFTTKKLGFETLKFNVVAAQMGRGKNERTIAAALGSLANTLSRFAMDICLYMSQNFDFIAFPDTLITGSSIMPHKKNPDVFELIRGKSNKIQALQIEMILITNNLPSGYHRDFQLLKENMISALEEMKTIMEVFNYSIQQIQVKKINLQDEKYKHLTICISITHVFCECGK